jgi:hypothetical protein
VRIDWFAIVLLGLPNRKSLDDIARNRPDFLSLNECGNAMLEALFNILEKTRFDLDSNCDGC